MSGRSGSNPLLRTTDRIESWCAGLLLAVLVVIGPLLAGWAAIVTYRQDLAAQAWEAGHRFAVDAVLLEEVAPATAQPVVVSRPAQARWAGPDGVTRTGDLVAPAGSPVGSAVSIWVDDPGVPAETPPHRNPRSQALAAAVAVLLCLAGVLLGIRAGVRAALDRHRMRQWDQRWLEVEPRWSSRMR
jgi:hypothetical protein